MSYLDVLPAADPFYTIGEMNREQWAERNKGVTPLFYVEPVQNPAKSAIEGRPIFDEEERVRIHVAGDQYNVVVHPVTEEIKERFADAYERFRSKRSEMHIDGTPLRAWPLLNPAQIAEFEALHIFNVEGLASVADSNLMRSHDLRTWRDKAQAWLASSKDGALAVRLTTENAQLREDLERSRADMKEAIETLTARLDRYERGSDEDDVEVAPLRRGRPRKA